MENKTFSLKSAISIVVFLILVVAAIVYVVVIMGGRNNQVVEENVIEENNEIIRNEVIENPVTEEQKETLLSFSKEEYPKIDGATAMRPMSLEIAKKVVGLTDAEAEEFVVHTKTESAYQNLIDKKVDLIFVSEPSDDILNKAKTAGIEFEMVGIGRDGFVFLVNKENPVNTLTLDQVQKIYTGNITNWSQVGGEDAEILAYQRNKNSGSQNLMEKMVMQGLEMMEVLKDYKIVTMGELVESIATFSESRRAIGYSIYLYAKEQYVRDGIKFLAINNVNPTDETIANGTYPLSKIVYAVYRKDEPENSNTRKLVEWLKTETGQKVVEAGGYVGCK